MQLTPRRPPGRIDRKAAAFGSEIVRLRSEGYTFETIREALADVGVVVSLSAVQREAIRALARGTWNPTLVIDPPFRALEPEPATSSGPSPAPAGLTAHVRSGREIAEAFVKNRVTNPLMRSRSQREDCRH